MATCRWVTAEFGGKVFLAATAKPAKFVTLRDIGSDRVWTGAVHKNYELAEDDAVSPVALFAGAYVAIVELREVSSVEAAEITATYRRG